VKRGDLEDRWDAAYLVAAGTVRFRYPAKRIAELCSDVFQGVMIKPGSEADPLVLKVKNLKGDHGIDFANLPNSTGVPDKKLLRKHDLISPFIGEAIKLINFSVFEGEKDKFTIDGNVGVMRPDTTQISARFLQGWFQTQPGRDQILRSVGGGATPFLGTGHANKLEVPVPPLKIQQQLVIDLDVARAARDAKLVAAGATLHGLDAFILGELGMTLPPPETVLPFAIRLSDAAHARVDTEYHSPRFRRLRAIIENGPYEAMSIADLCLPLITGFAAGGGDQADEAEGLPHLRPTNVTADGEITLSGSKYVPVSDVTAGDTIKPREVLFNNTNSSLWVGKAAVFDLPGICACSNHMTRLRLRNAQHSPVYLAALLNALRSIGYFAALATNFNNQAGINSDALSALRIPVPPPAVQIAIAAEVDRRRAEARRLRAEARAGWAAAQQAFEDALLGPTQ
jgi:restriction endonuclease S subunit